MHGQEVSKEGVKGDQWGEAFEGRGPGKALGRWRVDRDLNEVKELSDPGGPRQRARQWQTPRGRKSLVCPGKAWPAGGSALLTRELGFILRVWGP